MVHCCMLYTERAEMAAVSCGTSHASVVTTPLWWTVKNALYKVIHSCRITCKRSESAGERRIALYKSDQQQQLVRSTTAPSNVTAGIGLPAALLSRVTTVFVPCLD